jgi:hypothetical protein
MCYNIRSRLRRSIEPTKGDRMSTSAEVTPPPVPARRPNSFARIGGLFSTPGSTMADIADRPDWLVPFLLILVVSVGLNFVAAPHLDIETGLREQLSEWGLTDQQIDDAVDRVAVFQKFGTPIAAVTVTILLIGLAALYMLLTRVMGGEGTFKQFFGVTNYAWLPQLVKGVLVTLLLVRAGSVEPEGALFALLSSIDVFNFAALALMIFGYGRASKLGTQKTAVIVIASYVVWIGVRAGIAALRG